MTVTRERAGGGRPDPEHGYLLFARGALDAVAERMPSDSVDVGPRVPLLRGAEAEAMAAALRGTAARVASAATGALSDFITALGDLGAEGTSVYPLLSVLALDGLVGSAVAGWAGGGAVTEASVFAVSIGELVPFFRACVRPGGPSVAAVFPCGTLFPWASELEQIFRVRAVQRCLAGRDGREEVVAEMPAREQLDRISALRYASSAFEFHAYNRIPVFNAGRLAGTKEPAVVLARAVMSGGGGRDALARLLSEIADRALTSPFRAADRLEAALGVLFNELAVAWVRAGQLPEPGPYRVKEAGVRAFGGGRVIS
ncbi:MAG: hypothetical protein ACYC41_05340 [Bacillota bacterium]